MEKTKKEKLPFHLRYFFFRSKIKRKLKELASDKNRVVIWSVLFLAVISVISGLVVFTLFLHGLYKTYTFAGNGKLELEASAQVGDFVGGVVGALWSFTGTLLFFVALQLQRTELTEMRKESQVNRITDIIYRQLDYFDKSLQRFTITDITGQNTYTGINAVIYLRERVESVIKFGREKDKAKKRELAKKYIVENIVLAMKNDKSLLALFESLDSSIDVLRAVFFTNPIPPRNLNELKAVFFKNVPGDLLNTAECLASLLKDHMEREETEGEKQDRLFSPQHQLITKINAINEFRTLIYDKTNTKVTEDMKQMYYFA